MCAGTIGAESPRSAKASRDMPSGRLVFGAFVFVGSPSNVNGAAAGRDMPSMSLTSAMAVRDALAEQHCCFNSSSTEQAHGTDKRTPGHVSFFDGTFQSVAKRKLEQAGWCNLYRASVRLSVQQLLAASVTASFALCLMPVCGRDEQYIVLVVAS